LPYHKNCRQSFKNDCIFYVDGRMTDLVQSFSHLGLLITSDSDGGEDIITSKYSFIGQDNNTFYYFGKLSSFINCNQLYSYFTSYYDAS